MRRHIALVVGSFPLALSLALPGCSAEFKITPSSVTISTGAAQRESEKIPPQRVEVAEAPKVVVDNRVGFITISAGEAGVVEVEAEKHAATKEELAEIKLAVDKKGDVVTVKWDTDKQSISNQSLDITIKAPRATSLQLHTGSGAISVDGFEHGADAKTDVGSITLKGVAGDLTLHSGSGAITTEGATGAVVADSGVGSVTVKGSTGSRKIHTGSGAISLDGAQGAVSARTDVGRIDIRHAKGDLTLYSGSGAIQVSDTEGSVGAESGVGAVSIAARLTGQSRIKTGSGAIAVTLPADSKLKVDASTGTGAIHNDFGFRVEGLVSHDAKGTIGDGSGGSLHVKTGIGSIDLKKK
jgi:DUF4097 and DUF4098 domain-containing protein YvlB